jgi:hypothetical protein
MADLSKADFTPGTDYEAQRDGGVWPLTLTTVEALDGSPREGGGFRLEFQGAPDLVLEQGIYVFTGDGETREIFIGPIARDQKATTYEAVFF